MKFRLTINSNGKAGRKSGVRKSLPYLGIARRACSDAQVQQAVDDYCKEIDISAVILRK